MKRLGFLTCLAASMLLLGSVVFGQTIALQPFLTGLSSPVHLVNAKDGTNRLFVVQQRGIVRVVQPGQTTFTDFLNISGVVSSSGSERGLLGLAFHPQYATNRRFFVYYTRQSDGAIEIAEYETPVGTPNVANNTAVRVIITVPHPSFSNHNGGTIAFGPDGYLYAGTGDGGSGNDPGNNAQNTASLLGKMLRLDIDTPVNQVPAYNIPPTNPFVGVAGADEIFAFGLRNPYRFSFDRDGTNQLWVGDVGQDAREEVDIVTNGGNFGWRIMEGTICTPGINPNCTPPAGHIPPVTEYANAGSRIAVTGGYVYRGSQGVFSNGTYVFADYGSGEIFTWDGATQTMRLDTPRAISSFGEDEAGELFVVGLGGTVERIVGVGTPTPTNTPTATPTNTPTATPTNTPTATPTNTPTATPTNTPTATPTATPTNTPTATPTNTPTATPTNTPTATPTNTPTATPTPGFEGDVAPRPNGDGEILSTDVTQLRRFAAGLDTPDPATNEGQRADGAPRTTSGDGSINAADVVQGRRYAAGLDPLTGAGGPTASPAEADSITSFIGDIYAYFFGREVRIGAVEAKPGQAVIVPIELVAQGGETATGFTLEFDPTLLSNPSVSLGADFESAALTVNSTEAEKGRIGILVDMIDPVTYSAEPIKIVYVRFEVSGDSPVKESSLNLTSSLAATGTSDAFGEILSTRYRGGKVSIIR